MTLYDVLGVDKKSTKQEIKEAYKNLLKEFHPDYYIGSKELAAKKTEDIVKAYRVLSNHNKRAEYDSTLHNTNYKKEYEYQQASNQFNYSSEPQQGDSQEDLFSNKQDTDHYHQSEIDNNYSSEYYPAPDAKTRIQNSPLPMKWFRFDLYFCLPLAAILGFLTFFPFIKVNVIAISNITSYALNSYLLFNIFIRVTNLILYICCFFAMKKLSPLGYKLNIVLLIMTPITNTLSSFTNGLPFFLQAIIITITALTFYILPSFIYFEKRKFLFFDNIGLANGNSKNCVLKYTVITIILSLAFVVFTYFCADIPLA